MIMAAYLKALGYKNGNKDTPNNKEFKLVDSVTTINEELTTFGSPAYTTTETYELFLSKRYYDDGVVQGIVGSVMDENEVLTCTADTEVQERGYLITIIFEIKA